MTFDLRAFSAENLARCESRTGFNHPIDAWSLSDWMTATLGELGEAANIVKKINRYRDGIPGNTVSLDQLQGDLADELADSFIYLDLMAQAAGIDLPNAVRSKFNRTSTKIGYVAAPPPQPSPLQGEGDAPREDFVVRAKRKESVARGYTGEACLCGAFKMKRNGACLVCDECGMTRSG